MGDHTSPPACEPLRLDLAYAELNRLVLEACDVESFLDRLTLLVTQVVPGTRCAVTLRTDGRGRSARDRGSEASLPLVVHDAGIGTLRLLASDGETISASDFERAEAFARQAASALAIVLRQSRRLTLDEQAPGGRGNPRPDRSGPRHPHVLPQASWRQASRCSARHRRCRIGRSAWLPPELIRSTTGHEPQPPRPLAHRTATVPSGPRAERQDAGT